MSAQNEIEIPDSEISKLRPHVLTATGFDSINTLNVYISGKLDEYIDVHHQSYDNVLLFKARWLRGFADNIKEIKTKPHEAWREKDIRKYTLFTVFQRDEKLRRYVDLTLERTYLKKQQKYVRVKPFTHEILWLGDNSNIIGLPIYAVNLSQGEEHGKWTNHDIGNNYLFPADFWTVGHVLVSGLIDYNGDKLLKFDSADEFLEFYMRFIKNQTAYSEYEAKLAWRYCEYVKASDRPRDIPLLIPQYRYGGLEIKHKYRLDFMIINPFTQQIYGLELSPFSSHGMKEQFERDSEKQNDFVIQKNVKMLSFSDKYLQDTDALFEKFILPLLTPEKPEKKN